MAGLPLIRRCAPPSPAGEGFLRYHTKRRFSHEAARHSGVYLVNGVPQTSAPAGVTEADAKKGTIAYGILQAHNTSGDSMHHLRTEVRLDDQPRHHLCRHHPDGPRVRHDAVPAALRPDQLPQQPLRCRRHHQRGATTSSPCPPPTNTAASTFRPNMADIHSYNRETMAGGGRDDPRLRLPHPLRRPSAPWPSARAAASWPSSFVGRTYDYALVRGSLPST